jgi:RHS repeat-associated protein
MVRSSDLAGMQHVGSTSYSYDALERVATVQHRDASGMNLLANYTYTYDIASRLTSETLNGGPPTNYSYDDTNQLTNDGTNAYTYDLNGNRTLPNYQTGAGNRLLNDGTWTYTYDNEGNLIRKATAGDGEVWTFDYDHHNHLVSASHQGGAGPVLATSSYDALDHRVEKDVSTGGAPAVTKFVYDGQEVLADLDSGNTLQRRYLHGDVVDQLFARLSFGAMTTAAWYLADRQGSVRDLTDATGAVQDHLTYDGFGNATETNPAFGDRYQYTGREFDRETGLQYNRARYYDPKIGRWTSEDPKGFDAGDANWYRYVHNGPTNGTDPSGLYFVVQGSDEAKNWVASLSGQDHNSLKVALAPTLTPGTYQIYLVDQESQRKVRDVLKQRRPNAALQLLYMSLLQEDTYDAQGAAGGVVTRIKLSAKERYNIPWIRANYQWNYSPPPAGQMVVRERKWTEANEKERLFVRGLVNSGVKTLEGTIDLVTGKTIINVAQAKIFWRRLSPSQKEEVIAHAAQEVWRKVTNPSAEEAGELTGDVLQILVPILVTKYLKYTKAGEIAELAELGEAKVAPKGQPTLQEIDEAAIRAARQLEEQGPFAMAVRKTQWGWENSPSWRAAVREMASGGEGGVIRSVAGKVPTYEEAVALIQKAGGTIQRVEGPHAAGGVAGHIDFPHINWTTAGGTRSHLAIQALPATP